MIPLPRALILRPAYSAAASFASVYRAVLVMVLAALATSCQRRPLEEEWVTNGYADILLMTDWKLLTPYETPTGLTAIFYPVDGGKHVTTMSNNTKQNVVRLALGTYDVLVFNQSIYEFGSMNFTNMDAFETACANLNPLTAGNTLTAADYKWLSQTLHNSDSIALGVREPEFFHADRFRYEVTEELCMKQFYKETGIVGSDVPVWDIPDPEEYVDTIFSTPPPVPPTLYVKVHVKGINNAYQVRAYINNMSRSVLFGPHKNTEEPAIHVISNWAIHPDPSDKTIGTFDGSVRCFGVPTMQVQEHEITLQKYDETISQSSSSSSLSSSPSSRAIITHEDYGRNIFFMEVLLKDGKTHRTFAFDVTDHIDYTEAILRLDLVLNVADYPGGPDGVPGGSGSLDDYPVVLPDVPDVIGSGGAGFDATVEDWKHEDHTIRF